MPPLLRDLLRPYRRIARDHPGGDAGADAHEPGHALAAEDHPGQRRRQPSARRDGSPGWFPMVGGTTKTHIAAAAGIATVAIAVVSGAAFYVASYSTERLGQSIGNDLRVRLYHHLQELSLAYYDTNRVGTILSTLTTDVQTIQSFASTSTLNIFTDALTLVAMIVVMFVAALGFRADRAGGDAAPDHLPGARQQGHQDSRRRRCAPASPICSPRCRRACSRSRWCRPTPARTYEDRQVQQGQQGHRDGVAQDAAGVGAAVAGRQPGDRAVHGPGAVAGRPAHPGGHDDGGRADRVPLLPGAVLPAGARAVPDDQHPRPGVGGIPASDGRVRRRHRDPGTSDAGRTRTVQGRDRLRARLLRLRRRRAGVARRLVHDRRGPDGRHRRPHRQRQIHPRQPHPAVPRPRRRPDHDRRCRHRRLHAARTAHPDRLRAAVHGAAAGNHPRQHRLRPPRRHRRGDHRGGQTRQRRRVHRPHARRLRQPGRRPRQRRCPAVSANASGSPVRSSATTRSSFSTSRPRRWMPSPSTW